MRRCVALVADLIFESKIAETARQLGASVTTARTPAQALAQLADGDRFLVDLSVDAEATLALLAQLRSQRHDVHVVAFLSHVQVELVQKARAAGADLVLPRSEFTRRLPELLCA
ncbi:MAG: hypothetical protein CHACPFDD_03007 [Phycisphaerae bacterium]|nr:hypothetical protein [Phycisphaerae bacterium]